MVGITLKIETQLETEGYYLLTVPICPTEDVRRWAEEHCDRYGFDYESSELFPVPAAAVSRGQLIFWPLDDSCLDRLHADRIRFERLDMTADQIYAEAEG